MLTGKSTGLAPWRCHLHRYRQTPGIASGTRENPL